MVTVRCSCCLISCAGLALKASCSLSWHPSGQCLYKELALSGSGSTGKQFYISWAQQERKNIWICLHFLIFVTMPSYFKQSGYSISTYPPLIHQNCHKPPEIWESDVSFNVKVQCFKLIGTGGGAVTASAKTLWWKCWLMTYPWERRGSTLLLLADWIASRSLVKEVGSPVQPLPLSPGIWKRWKVLYSVFSLGRDHKWCPVLATDNAGCHGGQDGWWLVQCIPVQFSPEVEMHSLLGCGTFCSSQEKMVRSYVADL